MSLTKVRQAIYQHLVDQGVPNGWPYFEENAKKEPPVDQPWAQIYFVPNTPTADTVGKDGEDLVDGFIQIDLKVAPDTGTQDVEQAFEDIRAVLPAGLTVEYNGQRAHIISCGRSQGRHQQGWYTVSVTINWRAWLSRIPTAHWFERNLLLENGGFLLMENGGRIILE